MPSKPCPNLHLHGGLTITGNRVPASVVDAVYKRMFRRSFTTNDLTEVAIDALREANKPVTLSTQVVERVRHDHREKCIVIATDRRRCNTYLWLGEAAA